MRNNTYEEKCTEQATDRNSIALRTSLDILNRVAPRLPLKVAKSRNEGCKTLCLWRFQEVHRGIAVVQEGRWAWKDCHNTSETRRVENLVKFVSVLGRL